MLMTHGSPITYHEPVSATPTDINKKLCIYICHLRSSNDIAGTYLCTLNLRNVNSYSHKYRICNAGKCAYTKDNLKTIYMQTKFKSHSHDAKAIH